MRNAAAKQERFAIAEDDCLWDSLPFLYVESATNGSEHVGWCGVCD